MKDKVKTEGYNYKFSIIGHSTEALYAVPPYLGSTGYRGASSHDRFNTIYGVDADTWGRPLNNKSLELTMLGYPDKDQHTKKLAAKIMSWSDGIICALDLTENVDTQIDYLNEILKLADSEIKMTKWVKTARTGAAGQPDLVPYDLPPIYLMLTNYSIDKTKERREQMKEDSFDALKSRINYPVKDVFVAKRYDVWGTSGSECEDKLRDNADFRKLSKALEAYIETRERDTREYHSTLAAFFKPKGRSRTEKLEAARALKARADEGKELGWWDFRKEAFENGELEKLVSSFKPK